jgi:hypothetical protein
MRLGRIDPNAYDVIDSNKLERDLSEKPLTFFRIPLRRSELVFTPGTEYQFGKMKQSTVRMKTYGAEDTRPEADAQGT